jgi:hypothetical protein
MNPIASGALQVASGAAVQNGGNLVSQAITNRHQLKMANVQAKGQLLQAGIGAVVELAPVLTRAVLDNAEGKRALSRGLAELACHDRELQRQHERTMAPLQAEHHLAMRREDQVDALFAAFCAGKASAADVATLLQCK